MFSNKMILNYVVQEKMKISSQKFQNWHNSVFLILESMCLEFSDYICLKNWDALRKFLLFVASWEIKTDVSETLHEKII